MRLIAIPLFATWICLSAPAALGQATFDRWGRVTEVKPVPVALGGYCVVSLRDQRQWQPGVEALSLVFDGSRYQFPSARERDIFAAAPQSYAPMLRGDCPVTFAEAGKRVRGKLDYGMLHGSRLVFFASEDDRRYFLEDPARFTNVDVADGGRCVVTRRNAGKDVPGIPETAAVYRGLRYFFASAHDRALFLKDPARYDRTSGGEGGPLPEKTLASDSTEIVDAQLTPWSGSLKADDKAPPRPSNEQDVVLGALPAMTGYCPVTLKKDGAWIRGRYEYRVELGSLVFLTAGPKERDALLSDPAAYVPALGGDCVVSFVADEERVRGSVYHAFEYEGRLFLFADAERKAAFKASPAKFTSVDVAAEGRCVVTLIDSRREEQGLAEHATWYEGKLYRFACVDQLKKFLADPARYAQP
jgi:YHS domain-containing protein